MWIVLANCPLVQEQVSGNIFLFSLHRLGFGLVFVHSRPTSSTSFATPGIPFFQSHLLQLPCTIMIGYGRWQVGKHARIVPSLASMRPALCHEFCASHWRVPATGWLRPVASPRALACRVPRVCLAAKSGGRVAGPRSRGRGSNPMDWAKESRMARWRRRGAATVLAMLVLLGAMGGAISSGRAKVLQDRLETGQIEYATPSRFIKFFWYWIW